MLPDKINEMFPIVQEIIDKKVYHFHSYSHYFFVLVWGWVLCALATYLAHFPHLADHLMGYCRRLLPVSCIIGLYRRQGNISSDSPSRPVLWMYRHRQLAVRFGV